MYKSGLTSLGSSLGITNLVQLRGSIPLSWSQDPSRAPKPPIVMGATDPFYHDSALHFNNLARRYGMPITLLNLVKQTEKNKRESMIGEEYQDCVDYLNQFLDGKKKLIYFAWDVSCIKNSDLDVSCIKES
jgi:hypothetical protein